MAFKTYLLIQGPVLAGLVIGLAGLPLKSARADWPTYRANAARSGYTAEPVPNRLRLRWVFRAPHPPRPAWPTSKRCEFDLAYQPIIAGDSVLFGTSTDDKLYALDAQTGDVRWAFFAEGPIRFAPAAWRDRVFVASDDGCLYALRLADGQLLWRHRGGPNGQRVLGNQRVVSRWPARGGPVVYGDTVYYAAGIWPSDGIYLQALDAETGSVRWTNDQAGGLYMPQPHGGAEAASGVSPQGYLLATPDWLFAPTGRAVPAAFRRQDGALAYYHLQGNQQRGGTRAMVADRYLFNAGCLFDAATGQLAARQGLGLLAATQDGVLHAAGRSLAWYRWSDAERRGRKGERIPYRRLVQHRLIEHDREVFELIVAGEDAICGEGGRVSAVDFTRQRSIWWSHEVEGNVRGLAAANGRLVASTDRGVIYGFDGTWVEPPVPGQAEQAADRASPAEGRAAARADRAASRTDYAKAAEQIIARTGITDGYCVDMGAGTGDLALELAKRTRLHIYGVEPDAKKAAAARRKLDAAGLYGVRVTIHCADPASVGYPDYFANLVVSAASLQGELPSAVQEQMRRIQRPYGGKICTGPPGQMVVQTRGSLEGAGSWTHQNANAANTLCSRDRLLKGRLRVFWFRDVDFEIPNRHGQGPAPQAHRGYLIVGGVNGLCALDAYNGQTLWKFDLPNLLSDYDGIHHDVGVGDTGGVFCLSDDSVYLKTEDRCLRIDLATGRLLGQFKTPVGPDDRNRAWGYLAYDRGLLFGSVANEAHTVSPRYKLTRLRTESVRFFAMNAETGSVQWRYQPRHSIRNNAIAVGGGRVYLIDRPIALADRITNPRRGGKPRPPLKPDEHPTGTLMAFDAASGKLLWEQSEGIFGTQLALSESYRVLLMCYQAVPHKFFKLPSEIGGRLAAFHADTGQRLWVRQAQYQTRPILIDRTVYAQGGAWDLLTGASIPFPFHRSYGCGQICASADTLFFRSATLGYWDLARDDSLRNFGGIRLGCWINAVPAGGIVLVPDGSSKCICSYPMRAWVALSAAAPGSDRSAGPAGSAARSGDPPRRGR